MKIIRRILTFLLLLLVLSAGTVNINAAEQSTGMKVTFFDVGEGDAALVECGSHYMLIDGGTSSQSQFLYTYLKNNGISKLDYIVLSHPHEDHAGGLAGALNYAKAEKALSPVTNYEGSIGFSNFKKYFRKMLTIPEAGARYKLGDAEFTVLGPIQPSDSLNNMSLVIRLEYGNTSFLFTGDMERDEEQTLLDAGVLDKTDVLKVAHHGSETSTIYPFLKAVMPEYAIISTGADNTYGHPNDDVLSRLNDAGAEVFRTDRNGTITATSDGNKVSITVEKEAGLDTGVNTILFLTETEDLSANAPEDRFVGAGTEYVLNTNSKKFHYPWCKSVNQMKEKNKELFIGEREDVINKGYEPCKNCKP